MYTLQVAKAMDGLSLQARNLAAQVQTTEIENTKRKTQLAIVQEAEQENRQRTAETEKRLEEKEIEIKGLQEALEVSRRKELNPGEFSEVLVHKLLQTTNFQKFTIELCFTPLPIGLARKYDYIPSR